jgi:hypothetical protein
MLNTARDKIIFYFLEFKGIASTITLTRTKTAFTTFLFTKNLAEKLHWLLAMLNHGETGYNQLNNLQQSPAPKPD